LLIAVRFCEQQLLERVNICMSLALMSPSLLTSIATIVTLVAYTSSGHQLSGLQVNSSYLMRQVKLKVYSKTKRQGDAILCLKCVTLDNFRFIVSPINTHAFCCKKLGRFR
jgi:type IV secretory pathway TraG/TraD family ATPase VirD4